MTKKRNPPTLDDIREAISLAPAVTDDDLTRAIDASGESLTDDAKDRLLIGVQQAFAQYFQEKIWLALGKRPTPSEVAREINGIAGKAEKLLATFASDNESAARKAALSSLRREAERYGEDSGGYPDLPPRIFSVIPDSDGNAIQDAIDYRGDEKIAQIVQGLELLKKLADAANKNERSKVEKGRKILVEAGKSEKAIRGRDEVFARLIDNLNGCWMDAFEKFPGVSRPGKGEEVGGPYIRFLVCLFSSSHQRTPLELDEYAPGLRGSLDRTPESLSHGFRKAKRSKLGAIAKPDPK